MKVNNILILEEITQLTLPVIFPLESGHSEFIFRIVAKCLERIGGTTIVRKQKWAQAAYLARVGGISVFSLASVFVCGLLPNRFQGTPGNLKTVDKFLNIRLYQ